jgi:hypothetical protein
LAEGLKLLIKFPSEYRNFFNVNYLFFHQKQLHKFNGNKGIRMKNPFREFPIRYQKIFWVWIGMLIGLLANLLINPKTTLIFCFDHWGWLLFLFIGMTFIAQII